MHVVSSGQKCPAGLPGRSPVSNGPTRRIPGALVNTGSSISLNELQMTNSAISIARLLSSMHCNTIVGFYDCRCSSKRSELCSWAACGLLLHLLTVASAEEAAAGRGRWCKDLGCRRNSREGEKDRSPKKEEEKPTENRDLLL
ncbi:hypothetical protein BHE74_00050101 [Ensete ventricosum]|nr:hypothetical protein BHE74_00050101 [Ensete ventricosum]